MFKLSLKTLVNGSMPTWLSLEPCSLPTRMASSRRRCTCGNEVSALGVLKTMRRYRRHQMGAHGHRLVNSHWTETGVLRVAALLLKLMTQLLDLGSFQPGRLQHGLGDLYIR
jgi:hypothetical protein